MSAGAARWRRLVQWLLWNPMLFWIGLIGVGLAVGAATIFDRGEAETGVRYASGGLQLVGTCLTAVTVWRARVHLGAPSLASRVCAWFGRARYLWRGRVVSVTGHSVGSSFAQAAGAVLGPAPTQTLEERLRAIEQRLEAQAATMIGFDQRLNRELPRLEALIEAERSARLAMHQQAQERGLAQSLELLDWQAVGIVWFVLGTLGGSFTKEIACLTPWLW